MAYSTTFLTFVTQLLQEPGLVGPSVPERFGYKFTAATIGATSLTTLDPDIVALYSVVTSSNTFLRGWRIYLETNAEERVVTTGSISGSTVTLTFTGGASATTVGTPSNVYLLKHCSWSELKAQVNDCLEYIPVECMIPLAHGPTDYDLQDSDTVDASWTESNATDSVQSTAAEVWMGARSLVITDSGSGGGYTGSTVVRHGQGTRGWAFEIGKADVGTCALRVTDQSGNTLETVEFTQEDWLLIKKPYQLASDDEGITLRLMGTTASAEHDAQFAWLVKEGNRIFRLPSWIDERFKVKGVARGIFHVAGAEPDTWLADSVEFTALINDGYNREYRMLARQADANPHVIVLEPTVRLSDPLFIIIESTYALPYGVAAIFVADSTTTVCPPHLLTARVKQWIGSMYEKEYPALKAAGLSEYKYRSIVRMPDPAKMQSVRRDMF